MARYKYFTDLVNSKAYTTHTVDRFDSNATSGGGVFKWIDQSNVGITEITGFRVKPNSTTAGYWERQIDNAEPSIGWFGTINTSGQLTLAGYGFTQAQINSKWVGIPANTILTTDTYDTAAIKYAFWVMYNFNGFQNMSFESKNYFLTSSCELPFSHVLNGGGGDISNYVLKGNGCWIGDHSTAVTAFDYFTSRTPTPAVAEQWQTKRYDISGFKFNGSGSYSGSGKAAILLGESYSSYIHDNHFEFLDIGIKNRFSMNTTIKRNSFTTCYTSGIYITYGDDYGGANTLTCSNHCLVEKNRYFGTGSTNCIFIWVEAASGTVIDGNIFEGATTGAGKHFVKFDSRGSTTCNELTIRNSHIERPTFNNQAFIYIRTSTFATVIDNPFTQYAGTLVETESVGGGYPEIHLRNIAFIQPNTKLKGNATTRWIFLHNRLPNGLGPITNETNMRYSADGSNKTLWYSGCRSTTSLTVGIGAKSLTIPLNMDGYTPGNTVDLQSVGTPAATMTGTVTSYNPASGALVVNIASVTSSGTYNDWNVWTNDSVPDTSRIIYFGVNSQGG